MSKKPGVRLSIFLTSGSAWHDKELVRILDELHAEITELKRKVVELEAWSHRPEEDGDP